MTTQPATPPLDLQLHVMEERQPKTHTAVGDEQYVTGGLERKLLPNTMVAGQSSDNPSWLSCLSFRSPGTQPHPRARI